MPAPTLLLADKATGHLPHTGLIPAPSAPLGHGLSLTAQPPEPQRALTSSWGHMPLPHSHPGTWGCQLLPQPHTRGRRLPPPPPPPPPWPTWKKTGEKKISNIIQRYVQSEGAEQAAIGINIVNYVILLQNLKAHK